MSGPCDGLRVVDLTQSHPGALATMVLADAGAEVFKIEPPGGDPTRRHAAWPMWHRGKKSVVLDLKSEAGRSDAWSLASRSDMVFESFRPGVAERLGVGYQELAAENPGLVYCSISGFGERGPYAGLKGYRGVVDAVGGRMDAFHHLTEPHRPRYPALAVSSFASAMNAVQGAMAALVVRERCGRGQKVDVSLLQSLGCYDLMGSLAWQMVERGETQPPGRYGGSVPAYMTARAKDGRWLQFGNLTRELLRNFLRQLGLEQLLEEERFENVPVFRSPEDREVMHRMCLERVLERTRDEWMEIFLANDVAAEPFMTTEEGLSHPQALHQGDVIELLDPRVGRTRQVGPIGQLAGTPVGPRGPAPDVDQNTDEFASVIEGPRGRPGGGSGPAPAHPLSGVTVLEFAGYIAAPFATALLADMGARVIKVEPVAGDGYRAMGYPKVAKTLQGKESIALDLKEPRAQEVIQKLAKHADVFLHHYRPGVPRRLGIDYETISSINPRIVYVYAGAYGSTGPYSSRAGFHPIAGAITGGPMLQAGSLLPPPEQAMTPDEIYEVSSMLGRANESNPDPSAALACGTATMLALYSREKTGKGQYVETTMLCGNLYANGDDCLSYEGKPKRAAMDRDMNGLQATYRLYECAEGWVFLACPGPKEWEVFARAAGLDGLLSDERFSTSESRAANDGEMAALLEREFRRRPAREWQDLLTPLDVACVEVFDGENGKFAATTPWVRDAGMMEEVVFPRLGSYYRHSPFFNFSLTPGTVGPIVELGEQTRDVMRDLGWDESEIEELAQSGVVVHTAPEGMTR